MSEAANTLPETLPLTPKDRKILNGRARLLNRMAMCLYVPLALGFGLALLKEVSSNGVPSLEWAGTALFFMTLIGGSIGAAHALLAWYERRNHQILRAELEDGIKVRRFGQLTKEEDGGDDGPMYFEVCDEHTGEAETFALRIIGELLRIHPSKLVGKRVEIEYAPRSRIVLKLQEMPQQL